ncbi:MAG: 4-diphosphocytidyl-2C-methyl-D-erythritol synthase [Actinobacteria bacterium BACL4 MAG-121001-bin59]|nr:MAG: 4-diphosphocytidyl-2C-methyl-D-erythritol synthase [Actinobacteria bacterium BACL4 MAG-121001-bin59]
MINKTAAIIAAAGMGHRLGANLPKSLVKLIDKTLLEHAVANLAPVAQLLIVTAPAGYENEYKKLLGEEVEVITGGVLRSDSIRIAIAKIPNNYEYVLVHDAARALASTRLASEVINQLIRGQQAVIPTLEVIDTIKEVDNQGYVRNTLNRASLKIVQTPQGFNRSVLERAHQASEDATDDAALVEALGIKVKTIAGEDQAFKITTKGDIKTAINFLLPDNQKQLRVGIGVDAHAFSEDKKRKLALAGLIWPDEIGLDGHSDGDVAAHAICDALLSAADLGDLGSNFGVADSKYKGATGAQMLSESLAKVAAAGFEIENVSVQIVGNRPKIAPKRAQAISALSKALAGAKVSLAATSTDGLGFTGEGKGLSAIATALLISKSS